VKPSIVINRTSASYRVYSWKTIKEWLIFVAKTEGASINYLSYTLLSDKELLTINRKSLGHNYYTDIITFDLSASDGDLFSDIYISYERVKENSKKYNASVSNEIKRVLVHGLLHLVGYSDKGAKKEKEMRALEDKYLLIYYSRFHVKHK
jgi:probable rRNA maturation factor